ncbi:DUF1904 domain-containing protein [Tepidibacter formicigenes]|jgi:hypothetical protein|uniref:DUF1904 family protein n=1 Tax=Tepidibacter formicigenes DSM 15518 TaxID=1123349 RepID=A0A1M6N923_9FIRM|nr:DUF1904 domain-containing protein [Tepidibacter formicigenes]SHJ92193.1 protein of unknown function [Tepidibacter formicigenes DSM 15518]
MPQIKIRGIKAQVVCKISEEMVDKLVDIVKCPRDYFEIECIQSVAIRDGKIAPVYPFIEVAWFDRGQEIQDKVAKVITDSIRENLDVESLDLAFTTFEKEKYYENGEHF